MKGFSSLAALLLAQNVLAKPVAATIDNGSETIPTGYITLNVPFEDTGIQPLSLRLDLQQSDDACGRASLDFNGAPLSQDDSGQGEGTLTLLDGVTISAQWAFICYKDEQLLQMAIHSINGRSVEDVSFRVTFQQTAPIRIKDIQGANKIKLIHQLSSQGETVGSDKHYYDSKKEKGTRISAVSPIDEEIDAKIAALEDLRHQAHNLKSLIREKEDEIMDRLSEVDYDRVRHDTPMFLKTCTDLDCIFRVLAYKMSHSDTSACRDAKHWRDALSCVSAKEDDHFDHKMLEELIVEDDIQHKYKAYQVDWDEIDDDDEWTEEDEEYWAWARLTMMVDVVKVALAFTCIYLCIAQYKQYRLAKTGQITLQYSREERRRLSFNDYFRGLFRNEDEELINEKLDVLPRWEKEQPYQTASVAAELSSFQDAASVVSDMIDASNVPRRSLDEKDEEKEGPTPPFL